jgi:hypothetical protein
MTGFQSVFRRNSLTGGNPVTATTRLSLLSVRTTCISSTSMPKLSTIFTPRRRHDAPRSQPNLDPTSTGADQRGAQVESPATVDRNDLLTAASAFLDVALAGDPDRLALARGMAFRASDWCVFGRPDDYTKLTRAAHLFRMGSHMKQIYQV